MLKLNEKAGLDVCWYEGAEGETDITLLNLDLAARWRCSCQRYATPVLPLWGEAQYPLQARLCWPRASLDVSAVNVRRTSHISYLSAPQSMNRRWTLCKGQMHGHHRLQLNCENL